VPSGLRIFTSSEWTNSFPQTTLPVAIPTVLDKVVESDRVLLLPQISALFETLKDDTDGVAKARIDSAFPLTDAQLGEITAALERHFSRKIEATVNVDPALIGGARITVGDTVIDASVQAQLQAMATRLRA